MELRPEAPSWSSVTVPHNVSPLWGVLLTKVIWFYSSDSDGHRIKCDRMSLVADHRLGLVFAVSMLMQTYGFAVVAESITICGLQHMLQQEHCSTCLRTRPAP
jgi:hypothetical protein